MIRLPVRRTMHFAWVELVGASHAGEPGLTLSRLVRHVARDI